MLLSVFPVPVDLITFKPDWFLIWLIAINYKNHEDCLVYSWVVGLLANIYYDLPLGSIAIIYVSLSYIFSIYFNKGLSVWQQNLFIVSAITVVEGFMMLLGAGKVEFTDLPSYLPVVSITVIVWYCGSYFQKRLNL